MPVYIPTLDMPQNCSACPVFHDMICKITGISNDECHLGRPPNCPLSVLPDYTALVEPGIYDEEELHNDCTVQVLRNSITGHTSVGWWENERGDDN